VTDNAFTGGTPSWDGRFAPSPTGALHVGNLRTALIGWLVARSHGARFVVRMEDLDTIVSRREFADQQLEDLADIGLDWDGPVVFQSERHEQYQAALQQLADRGLVYECFCTRKEIQAASQAPNGPQLEGRYPGTCRSLTARQRSQRTAEGRRPALRLFAQVDEGVVDDLVAGYHTFPIDDLVLRRNDGMWAYNLAVVVDDAAQGIGTVVRADDLLASTPRQIHLGDLLGLPQLRYVHVPLVVNQAGQRLAKRDGAVTLPELEAEGIDRASLRGALACSLGLRAHRAPIADVRELLPSFNLALVNREPWVFAMPR
jgi:glutamyl-tRNA synthetase